MIKKEDIKYRIGQVFKDGEKITGASFLIYIDARVAFDELDEKYPNKWSFDWEYIQGETGVKGMLTIDGSKHSDVGYPNDSKIDREGEGKGEWLKDAVSDAVKRCAVQVGIGRELYAAPFLYAKDVELNIKNNKINPYKPLNETGVKIIEGNIAKWYDKLNK